MKKFFLLTLMVLSLTIMCSDTFAQGDPPFIRVTREYGGWPWAPGLYVYVTIVLDSNQCTEGYIVGHLVSYVTSYIPWAGAIVSEQFRRTANEIISKNKGYGVKIVLKIPIAAVGIAYAKNTVTSRPPNVAIPDLVKETLGMNVFNWDGTKMVTKFATSNMGQGPGALAWRAADVNGDGKAEIIQPWANGTSLGMIVYGWDGTKMVTKWATSNMYQGTNALVWIVGDVDKNGKGEIIQPWANRETAQGLGR